MYTLEGAPSFVHVFYTGFTWGEIKQIWAAIKQTYKDENADFGDDYGGLPKKIYKRLSSAQVDYIQDAQPTTLAKCALLLARGWNG